MFSNFLNWRVLLSFIAICIAAATILFTNYLAKKIANEEKVKVEQWVEALKETANPNAVQTNLTTRVLTEDNRDIPMLFVNESDSIIDMYNLDTVAVRKDAGYLAKRLKELKSANAPVVWINPQDSTDKNYVYYGASRLSKSIKYFPLLQLAVAGLFIVITLYAINTRNKSTQNQVWAGMAKETAHQLGTPITSLQGWVEMLKSEPGNERMASEIGKDVERLKLVSERFGKIGSTPVLEEADIILQVENMVSYIKRRSPEKVSFNINTHGETNLPGMINPPLFDWVIENLLKNALDAMDGQGAIVIDIISEKAQILIDVKDTGKGIQKKYHHLVFKPGFSTKKRGWGLGLSLCKRIIEQYHKGELFVKHSEPGKGTTFRIILEV